MNAKDKQNDNYGIPFEGYDKQGEFDMKNKVFNIVRTFITCAALAVGLSVGASAAEVDPAVETTVPAPAAVEVTEKETVSYTDVYTDSWFFTEVETLTEMGLIEGYEDGSFRPYNTITEAEALSIFHRSTQYFAYGQVQDATPVDGVPVGQWYSNAIGGLQAEGLLNRKIAVNAAITRENMTVMAARTLGYQTVDADTAALATSLYNDVSGMTLEQKYSAVVTNNENVVIGKGDGTFGMGTMTRAEGAVIIYRMMEAIGAISSDDSIIIDEPNDEPTRPQIGDDDSHIEDDPVDPDPVDPGDDDDDDHQITIEIQAPPASVIVEAEGTEDSGVVVEDDAPLFVIETVTEVEVEEVVEVVQPVEEEQPVAEVVDVVVVDIQAPNSNVVVDAADTVVTDIVESTTTDSILFIVE